MSLKLLVLIKCMILLILCEFFVLELVMINIYDFGFVRLSVVGELIV